MMDAKASPLGDRQTSLIAALLLTPVGAFAGYVAAWAFALNAFPRMRIWQILNFSLYAVFGLLYVFWWLRRTQTLMKAVVIPTALVTLVRAIIIGGSGFLTNPGRPISWAMKDIAVEVGRGICVAFLAMALPWWFVTQRKER